MLKRLSLIGILAVPGAILLLVIWPPDSLKTKVFRYAAEEASKSIPYDVQIHRVSGNVLTGFDLKDITLRDKQSHAAVLRIQEITIGIGWRALFFHKLIRITHLGIRMSDGSAVLKGELGLKPAPAGQFAVEDQNFPLDKLLALGASTALPPLRHTGSWTIRKDSQTVTVDMGGRLDNAPIDLHGSWTPPGYYRGRMIWSHVPLAQFIKAPPEGLQSVSITLDASGQGMRPTGTGRITSKLADVNVRLTDGRGTFQAVFRPGGIQGLMHGDIDLAQRTVQGEGSIADAAWQEAHADKIDFHFYMSPRVHKLDVAAAGLQMHRTIQSPFDMESARISLEGLAPSWQTAASVKWRNGSSADMEGLLHQGSHSWRLAWRKLVFAFPSAGSWTADQEGSVIVTAGRQVILHDLSLRHGAQALQISQASFEKGAARFHLEAHAWEPAPWAALFAPQLALSGTLDAVVDVDRTKSDFQVNGFLNGHFPSVAVQSMGLALQNVDMDLRAADGQVTIRRLTAKTKKGTVQMTGQSRWSELSFTLRTKQLAFQPDPQLKIVTDADLLLSGSFESPVLTGRIQVSEAVYTTPKNKKKESPKTSPLAPAAGSMDVALSWPRNVWYRDGASSIETRGDLRIQKQKDAHAIILTGSIVSIRGSYNYFGRTFAIDSGELQFGGTPEINPNLNIEASYASGPTTVYLDITGTTRQPAFKLHSSPPLPDQDIVSVIVFGQPLNELRTRTGGSSSNQEMMQAVGGVLGGYVTKGLSQTGVPVLNFDVLNIQPSDQGGSELTVGRYLTRKFFISYGQAVQGSAEKSVTADYFLTDKWTLQGASDSTQGNYMDFLFRYPLNKPGAPTNNPTLPASPFRRTLDQPSFQTQFRSSFQ